MAVKRDSDALPAEHKQAAACATGIELRVQGTVQGVGFRPAVWRIAQGLGLCGEVSNDGAGVLVRAWGSAGQLARLEAELIAHCPPLARIQSVTRTVLTGAPEQPGFRIVESRHGAVSTGVAPDAATCPLCLAEVLDPANRRYRYPFTNCTHCGPRLSILRAIPYDRASTSMSAFEMCTQCRAEYEDPADRRFHAEPNACPVCGPRLWLEDAAATPLPPAAGLDAIAAAAEHLRAGAILAVKGIGGFHLACDAANAEAVARLRQRKRRYGKPFAVMVRDLAMLRRYGCAGEAEAAALMGPAAPILVLDRLSGGETLPEALAPGRTALGVMLPYTPLHHLLLAGLDRPIVLTSGNASDEPQCTDNAEARNRLAGIADVWLMHDRDIVNRLDDSVARIVCGAQTIVRRGRGLAPEPLLLPPEFAAGPRVLALGGELKSTFCLLSEGRACLSQHIGDLEEARTNADFRAVLDLYRRIYAFTPDVIAVDRHPDYVSTQVGEALARETGARLLAVQHHHAHIAAVLAEHAVPASAPPVLGIVLDGLGLGDDGGLWGGEFLLADYGGFRRLAHFAPVPLLGGAKAMREPWRNAFAHLHAAFGWPGFAARHPGLGIVRFVEGKQPELLAQMIGAGVNCPPASSAGRLFDAAAAICGVHTGSVSYEGEAAIEFEALAASALAETTEGYPFEIAAGEPAVLSWRPLWEAMIGDCEGGAGSAAIAARFHRGLMEACVRLARRLCAANGLTTVALSGGVFQNRLMAEGIAGALRRDGTTVLLPRLVPANDGGLALGQAAIAHRISTRTSADSGL